MKIVAINTFNIGSTGKIMLGIADEARVEGMRYACFYPKSRDNSKKIVTDGHFIGNRISRNIHLKLQQIFGFRWFYSRGATKKLIKELKKIDPDIIHLHNIHGWYLNVPMLFDYIKKYDKKVVWTLHDCWAFTGHCPYFTVTNCLKWVDGCYECPSYNLYPESRFDDSKRMYALKRKCFTDVKHLTIITPSEWLSGLVKRSFLNMYPVKVINNGIDINIFKPSKNDFRSEYKIPSDKFVVIGVAFGWGKRKGLDVFIELAQRLSERYQIVLVGTNDTIDKELPKNIISIHRTNNQSELSQIYSAADVFVNPTREDNYPTVNMESISCGTPVITFKTGGSPEMLNEKTGIVVECDDIDALQHGIEEICEKKILSTENCVAESRRFDQKIKFKEYIELYKEINGSK